MNEGDCVLLSSLVKMSSSERMGLIRKERRLTFPDTWSQVMMKIFPQTWDTTISHLCLCGDFGEGDPVYKEEDKLGSKTGTLCEAISFLASPIYISPLFSENRILNLFIQALYLNKT